MIHRAYPGCDAGGSARRCQDARRVVGVGHDIVQRDQTAIRHAVVIPFHHQAVARNGAGLEILEFPKGRGRHRVFRHVDLDVGRERTRAERIDVKGDRPGPVRKIKRLPDHVGVVAVILDRDRGHELSRTGRTWIANQRVVGRINAGRGEGGSAGRDGRDRNRVGHRTESRQVRRREPRCAPSRRIEIAPSSPYGRGPCIKRVAERRVCQAAPSGRSSCSGPEQCRRPCQTDHECNERRHARCPPRPDRAPALSQPRIRRLVGADGACAPTFTRTMSTLLTARVWLAPMVTALVPGTRSVIGIDTAMVRHVKPCVSG